MECADELHLYDKVKNALRDFFHKDSKLLELDANERSISHKVGEHLQVQFSGLNVDCEYNRKKDKKQEGYEHNRKHAIQAKTSKNKKVFPDIIVHERGSDENNCLVIETKKKGRSIEEDCEKLKVFTGPKDYGYKVGLLLVFGVKKNKGIAEIIHFEGGKQVNNSMWANLKTEVLP